MQSHSDHNRLHHTISLKPTYDFSSNYLDFHISRQRSPLQRNSLTHRSNNQTINGNFSNIAYSTSRQRSSTKQVLEVKPGTGEAQEQIKEIVNRYQQIKDGSNQMLKSIVQGELLAQLVNSHPLMKKLNKYLVESLFLLGSLRVYSSEQTITQWQGQLCFILYGSAKLYNQDLKIVVGSGQLFGEHLLFDCKPQLKAKSLGSTCLMTLPLKNYQIIREESIKNGLKEEFGALEIAIRLNFIGKRLGENKGKLKA